MTRPLAFRIPAPIVAILSMILISIPASAAVGKFVTGPQQGDAGDIAQAYLAGNLDQLGLTAADLEDMVVRDRYATKHNGITHIYFQQRLDGIEVYNGLFSVNVARDGSIINFGNGFVGDLAANANTGSPTLADSAAIARAAEHFGLTPAKSRLTLLKAGGGPDLHATFADAALSRDDIPVRLVYQPIEGGGARLAWETMLNLVNSPDWWSVRVDAVTGEVIDQNNLTSYDSYLVIPMPPYSDPEDSGGQIVVTDPADATASPFGWHDTDGIAGGEFTDTQGNNVDAHDDRDGNNSGGTRPDGDMGGPMLEFDYEFDPADQPDGGTNLEAAIVNLFYANNVMHDVTYQYGFDEPAGNFQFNNYGNGGLGNDAVEADAQDNADGIPPSCNNANFSTPVDGFTPRMQMFEWTGIPNAFVTVNSGPAAGEYTAAKGCWGGDLDPATTGDVELVDDGSALPTEGCNALVGFTAGNVALIDRGSCDFSDKAFIAQTAGATGAIVVNNQQLPNDIISMGAGDNAGSVTIPAVMIGAADGQTIKDELAARATVNATLSQDPEAFDRDSDFDNGIIAHEYGHGISNRLTGGPGSLCLNGSEQAGEGWSDFWTMVLSAKPTDTAELAKGVGNYPSFLPHNGPGIRAFPYSTDLGVNPQTYGDIATAIVPHGVGSIWMTMVWEMYWELVAKHGFTCDLYGGTAGNNLTIQLVIDGMKLQGCNPTFVIARDAILAADLANNGGENECEIWRAFAKRGLGTGAIDGTNNVGDETENFDIPGSCPAEAPTPDLVFADSFECGNTARWDVTVGFPRKDAPDTDPEEDDSSAKPGT